MQLEIPGMAQRKYPKPSVQLAVFVLSRVESQTGRDIYLATLPLSIREKLFPNTRG